MHVVSTNFAKTVFANVNMTSYCDVTNNVCPVTMTTIRHCSIPEFGRGASNQTVALGITRPLHATESCTLPIYFNDKSFILSKRQAWVEWCRSGSSRWWCCTCSSNRLQRKM